MTVTREQPWSDESPAHGRILVLTANPISQAVYAIGTAVGRLVVVLADDDGGPGLASLGPKEGDAVVLCDHDAPDAPQFLRDALASPGWLVPVAGGALFTLLVVTVLTSAVWYLGTQGLPPSTGY